MKPLVGVLALQGDFAEHCRALTACGADSIQVRTAAQLNGIDGLIIPGGESTTIAKLTEDTSDPIFNAIRNLSTAGMPVYGTCMGSIFLAKEIEGSKQGRLALMDIKVKRNAFGPQGCSFEIDLDIPALGTEPFAAIFIRAPVIVSCGPTVTVLARLDEGIVMARQDNLLVSAFHPEITPDKRVHQYFLSMVDEYRTREGCTVPAVRCTASSLT
ncbi:MAG: pyridoxal 5'-phosphate synthase glutaminase subunit PdxT [Terriglobales bacterium]